MGARDEEHMIKLLRSLSITKAPAVEFLFGDESKREFYSHINTEYITIRNGEFRKRISYLSFGGFIETGANASANSHISRLAIVLRGASVEPGAVIMGQRVISQGMVVRARDPEMDIWP